MEFTILITEKKKENDLDKKIMHQYCEKVFEKLREAHEYLRESVYTAFTELLKKSMEYTDEVQIIPLLKQESLNTYTIEYGNHETTYEIIKLSK